jgi:hypothetical protein
MLSDNLEAFESGEIFFKEHFIIVYNSDLT